MSTHTFELPEIKDAVSLLISKNTERLIKYVYEHTHDLFTNPKVRIGLSLKVLLKSDNQTHNVNRDILELVSDDLMVLIGDTEDESEKQLYQKELRFLNSCSILDDMITLNTNLRANNLIE